MGLLNSVEDYVNIMSRQEFQSHTTANIEYECTLRFDCNYRKQVVNRDLVEL